MTATKVLVTPLSGAGTTGKYERTEDIRPVVNKYDKYSEHDPLGDTTLPWLKPGANAHASTVLCTAGVEEKCKEKRQDLGRASLRPARLVPGPGASIEVLEERKHDDKERVGKNGSAPIEYTETSPLTDHSRRIPSIAEELLVAKRENQIRYAVCAAFRKVPRKPSKFTKLERRPFRYSDELQSHVKKQSVQVRRVTKLYIDWWRTAYFTGGSDVFCALFCDLRLRRGIDGAALDGIKEQAQASLFEGVVSLNNSSHVQINAPSNTYSDEDETEFDVLGRSNEDLEGTWVGDQEFDPRILEDSHHTKEHKSGHVQAKRSFSGGPTLRDLALKRSNSASRTRSSGVGVGVRKQHSLKYGPWLSSHTASNSNSSSAKSNAGGSGTGSGSGSGKSVMKTLKDKTAKATGVKSIKKGVKVIERATRASVRAAPQAMFGLSRVRTNSNSGVNSRTSSDDSGGSREQFNVHADSAATSVRALRATASYESGCTALEDRLSHRERFRHSVFRREGSGRVSVPCPVSRENSRDEPSDDAAVKRVSSVHTRVSDFIGTEEP